MITGGGCAAAGVAEPSGASWARRTPGLKTLKVTRKAMAAMGFTEDF